MPATPTLPVNPIPLAVPIPTVTTSTATTQIPVVKSAATSIPVTVYILAQGKLEGIPLPHRKALSGRKSFCPQLQYTPTKQQPEVTSSVTTFQVKEDTTWPNIMPASTNLFEARADWPIPPTKTPAVKVEKAEVPPRVAAIPHAMVSNKF